MRHDIDDRAEAIHTAEEAAKLAKRAGEKAELPQTAIELAQAVAIGQVVSKGRYHDI